MTAVRKFSTWAAVKRHVARGRVLFYKAPLDYRPVRVRARLDGKVVRVFPPTSDADPFDADYRHLSRFLMVRKRRGQVGGRSKGMYGKSRRKNPHPRGRVTRGVGLARYLKRLGASEARHRSVYGWTKTGKRGIVRTCRPRRGIGPIKAWLATQKTAMKKGGFYKPRKNGRRRTKRRSRR